MDFNVFCAAGGNPLIWDPWIWESWNSYGKGAPGNSKLDTPETVLRKVLQLLEQHAGVSLLPRQKKMPTTSLGKMMVMMLTVMLTVMLRTLRSWPAGNSMVAGYLATMGLVTCLPPIFASGNAAHFEICRSIFDWKLRLKREVKWITCKPTLRSLGLR